MIRPVLHLGGGQLRVLGQQAGQPGQVAAVEDAAAFDFELELGPAGKPVLTGQRQLRRGQDDPIADRADARGCFRITALGGAQQFLGLMAELAEVGPVRQVSHDVSLVTRWSAAGPEENVIGYGLLPASGGGLCPARGPSGALQRLEPIVSSRTGLSASADGGRMADPEQAGELHRQQKRPFGGDPAV